VSVEGRNSLNHELRGCLFKGRSAGRVAVRTMGGGSIRMFGGAVVQFTDTVFDIDTANGVALRASGVHIEKCARLIHTPTPSASTITTHVVVLDGLRWGSDVDELPADGAIVDYWGGTLIVRGCWFGTGTPRKTVYAFRYDSAQAVGDFVFEDCRVRSSNGSGHWPGRRPDSVRGSLLYIAQSDDPIPIPS
jgi:hypothetical protein